MIVVKLLKTHTLDKHSALVQNQSSATTGTHLQKLLSFFEIEAHGCLFFDHFRFISKENKQNLLKFPIWYSKVAKFPIWGWRVARQAATISENLRLRGSKLEMLIKRKMCNFKTSTKIPANKISNQLWQSCSEELTSELFRDAPRAWLGGPKPHVNFILKPTSIGKPWSRTFSHLGVKIMFNKTTRRISVMLSSQNFDFDHINIYFSFFFTLRRGEYMNGVVRPCVEKNM